MAFVLEWVDSFDRYGTSPSAGDFTTEGYSASAGTVGITASGRTGNALQLSQNFSASYLRKTLSTPMATVFLAVAINTSTVSDMRVIEFYDGATLQAYLTITNSTTITLSRGDGTSQGTFTVPTMSANTWYHWDMSITFNDSSGAMTLYFGGTLIGTLSGKDLVNGGGQQITMISLGDTPGASNPVRRYDDLVIQPSTGLFPVTPIQIYYLAPTGSGSANDMSTDAGAGAGTNYQKVDETPPNGDTDYVQSATVGNRDLYSMANLSPSEGFILAVVAQSRTRLDTTGAQKLIHTVKTNGSEYSGATEHSPTTSFVDYQTAFIVNPSTNDLWTIAEVNAIEAGVKVG